MKIIKREKQPAYYLTTHPFAARTAAQNQQPRGRAGGVWGASMSLL